MKVFPECSDASSTIWMKEEDFQPFSEVGGVKEHRGNQESTVAADPSGDGRRPLWDVNLGRQTQAFLIWQQMLESFLFFFLQIWPLSRCQIVTRSWEAMSRKKCHGAEPELTAEGDY